MKKKVNEEDEMKTYMGHIAQKRLFVGRSDPEDFSHPCDIHRRNRWGDSKGGSKS